jgi:hypothetical protein
VNKTMYYKIFFLGEMFIANFTFVNLDSCVGSVMFLQMIIPGEVLATHTALVVFNIRVGSMMPMETCTT